MMLDDLTPTLGVALIVQVGAWTWAARRADDPAVRALAALKAVLLGVVGALISVPSGLVPGARVDMSLVLVLGALAFCSAVCALWSAIRCRELGAPASAALIGFGLAVGGLLGMGFGQGVVHAGALSAPPLLDGAGVVTSWLGPWAVATGELITAVGWACLRGRSSW